MIDRTHLATFARCLRVSRRSAAAAALAVFGLLLTDAPLRAQGAARWTTVWTASAQGPYPVGNASLQPDLKQAFPAADAGASDQSFRLIVRPDVWGRQARIRLSNVLGTRAVTFDDLFIGLQLSGSALVPGTNTPVRFNGEGRVTVRPGTDVWSDAVSLPFAGSSNLSALAGRKLAVSFHVVGESGPMTWHAKALQTSYVTLPGAGSRGREPQEQAFPASTTSWYFLDALDMRVPGPTRTIVAFGDSITDGTASTLNGDDRWPDVLSRRLHAKYGDRVALVNAGIGGNRVAGPAEYSAAQPFAGGPGALQRLERDVMSLSNVAGVILLEGINDFSPAAGTSVDVVQERMRDLVARLRGRRIRVFAATLTSAVGNGTAADSAAREMKRQALNTFIRTSGLFDGVFDFDRATTDPATGAMRDGFVPNSTDGGPGDHLHPNRQGYAVMADAVDLATLVNWSHGSGP